MAMLEMDCPSCAQRLELDAGFAGGVCRCSHCGTLMTVPEQSHQAPERLHRPAAPGAAASASREVPADAEEAPLVEPLAEDEPASTQQATASTLTTDSGRTVRIEHTGQIPTARRKRPFVRAATGTAVIAVIGGVTALIIYAMFSVLAPDAANDPTPTAADHFGYDPGVNVYELDRPNVLGLPLESASAVIVDASGASRDWLALAQDAIRLGITGHSDATPVALIYATELEPRRLSEEPTALSELSAEQVHEFQESIPARGVAPLAPAIEAALANEPRRIMLITGRSLDEELVASIEQALGDNLSVTLDIVLVDARSDAAEALAERHGGRAIELAQGQLLRWYRAADIDLP